MSLTPDMRRALEFALDQSDCSPELYIGTARTHTMIDQYGYVTVNAQTATRLLAAGFGSETEWGDGTRTVDLDLELCLKALDRWNQCDCGDPIDVEDTICAECWEEMRP